MAFLIHRYEHALFYDLKRLNRALESVEQTDLPVILSPAYEVTLESVCRFVCLFRIDLLFFMFKFYGGIK